MPLKVLPNNEVKNKETIRTQNGGYVTEIYAKSGDTYEKVFTGTREISGAPPLTFKAKGSNLKDYRIYGNTVTDDGSVTCIGTATARASPVIASKCAFSDNHVLSGCPASGGLSSYLLRYQKAGGGSYAKDTGGGVNIPYYSDADVIIRIEQGYTCNNLTFYPMIRKADIEDDTYEPYIENTDVSVDLPALPTIAGTNTLSFETEVQPSKVDVKGKIKKTL